VLAHGSVQDFAGEGGDEDDLRSASPNVLELDRIPADLADYVALGDWHGQCQVGPAAWYAGAIEQDRHARSADYVSGRVLRVTAGRGLPPRVEAQATGRLGWHTHLQRLGGDDDLAALRGELDALLGGRVSQDVLRLTLTGTVGLTGREQVDQLIETYTARLLRLDVDDALALEPGDAEIEALTSRGQDPVIGAVAQRLVAARAAGGREAAVATQALRELFLIVRVEGGQS
jgi:DNA repair exonuclease SbcCD nuclease subunit